MLLSSKNELKVSYVKHNIYCIDNMKYLNNILYEFWKMFENKKVMERKIGKMFWIQRKEESSEGEVNAELTDRINAPMLHL